MADGGVGEMALADMATADAGTIAASDAAMSTIPTYLDTAGQLANPFTASMLGGVGTLPAELTGADQMLLKAGADSASMLPGAPVAPSPQGIDSLNLTPDQAAQIQSSNAAMSGTGQQGIGSLNLSPSQASQIQSSNAAMNANMGINQGQSSMSKLLAWAQANPLQAAAMGIGGNYLFNQMAKPNLLTPYTPPSASSYGLGRTLAAGYQPTRPMAAGGLTVGAGSVPTQGVAPADLNPAPAQKSSSGLDALAAQYGISPQMVAQARQDYNFKSGGMTGEYAVGGKLLSGDGDGMSDSIKANIGGHQEARLGDGEFVVPADVVSHLGNGSTDAGAKQLYSMMDKVRKARTGRKAQGKQINPEKYLPA